MGAFGSKKAQVNLHSTDETYTLTATATNSEGTATDSITLNWGCEVPESEPVVIEREVIISADTSLNGSISGNKVADAYAYTAGNTFTVGDTSEDKYAKGYLTFSIAALCALRDIITIKEVEIRISGVVIVGEPWLAGSQMNIKVFYYGTSLDPDDFRLGGNTVKVFNTSSSLSNLTFSTTELKNELKSYVSSGSPLFQLKFGLNGRSTNGIQDFYGIYESNASLYVKYETAD